MTISSQLPDLVDAYITARAQRLALDKQVDELKSHEEVLKDAIITKMKEGKMLACGSTLGIVKMTINKEPQGQDWPAIYDYIKANDAFDLLHRRLTVQAVKDRVAEGEEIPGIAWAEVPRISVSKS
jgi:hypothetical protein